MKFKATKKGRRTITSVTVGGESDDAKSIWQVLKGLVTDASVFRMLFGRVDVTRADQDPEYTIEIEATPEEMQCVLEDREGALREMLHSALDGEAKQAEQKKLAAGLDPREPLTATPEEQNEAMKQLDQFLEEKRNAGYSFDVKEVESEKMPDGSDALIEAERRLLELTKAGRSDYEIAQELGLSGEEMARIFHRIHKKIDSQLQAEEES